MEYDYQVQLAYSAKLFGFMPDTFTDSIYNAVFEYTYQSLERSQEFMKDIFPEIMTDDDYEDAFNFLMESFCTRITKSFDKLSQYVKSNIMIIPEHILLKEDELYYNYRDIKMLNESLLEKEKKMYAEKKELDLEYSVLYEELNYIEKLILWNDHIREERRDTQKSLDIFEKVENMLVDLPIIALELQLESLDDDITSANTSGAPSNSICISGGKGADAAVDGIYEDVNLRNGIPAYLTKKRKLILKLE